MASVAGARKSSPFVFNEESNQSHDWGEFQPGTVDASSSHIPWPDDSNSRHTLAASWNSEAPKWNSDPHTFIKNFPLPSQTPKSNTRRQSRGRGNYVQHSLRQSGSSASHPTNNQSHKDFPSNATGNSTITNPTNNRSQQSNTTPMASGRTRGKSYRQRRKTDRSQSQGVRLPSAEINGETPNGWNVIPAEEHSPVAPRTGEHPPEGQTAHTTCEGNAPEIDKNVVVDTSSVKADAGDGNLANAKPLVIQIPREQHIDLSLDVRDFDGDWAPAPPDWEDRVMFQLGGNYAKTAILDWDDGMSSLPIRRSPVQLLDADCKVLNKYPDAITPAHTLNLKLPEQSETPNGEICPREWIPEHIDESGRGLVSLTDWWASQLRWMSEFPVMFEKDSDDKIKPFWDRYTGWDHELLTPLRVPEPKADPMDNNMMTVQRQTAEMSCVNRDKEQLRKEHKAKSARKDRLRSQRDKLNYVPPPNPYTPRANVYFRPAEEQDVPQLQGIWNYWMTQTIYDPHIGGLSLEQVQERLEDIRSARLPFIVAVDRALSFSRQKEYIVGFAAADEYSDSSNMYRYTVEVDIFVHHESLRKGIGRVLLDKITSVLDGCYVSVGGYEWHPTREDEFKYTEGGQRIIEWIYVHVPHEAGKKEKLDWTTNLLNKFGYKQKGYFDDIGRKLSQK